MDAKLETDSGQDFFELEESVRQKAPGLNDEQGHCSNKASGMRNMPIKMVNSKNEVSGISMTPQLRFLTIQGTKHQTAINLRTINQLKSKL